MPNLPAHIDLAHEAAKRLGYSTLDDHLGYFLLGSTSPDIRVITRRRREEYHFAPLDFEAVGAGIQGMFESHPDLGSPLEHDGPTQAFVAGYITHLVADETWIVDMYRPYFGVDGLFEDEVTGNVMDRAMQMELDRQAWRTAIATRGRLEQATDGITTGIVPPETLSDWREWVVSSIDRGFSWDRLRFMARRIAAGNETHRAHDIADRFLVDMPDSLEGLFGSVSKTKLADYKERTVQAVAGAVESYLS